MKTKIIFKTYLARNLLRLGNQIIDIKPDKYTENKTLFIFEETEKFKKDLEFLVKQ